MKVLTVKEYSEINNISERTVYRHIIGGHLPSYIRVKKLEGRGYVLWTDNCMECEVYFKASIEYNRRKGSVQSKAELAAELCVKYDLGVTKFFAMHGIK